MKNWRFWVGRFGMAAALCFAVLAVVYLLRGRPMQQALTEALMWACVTAAVYTGVLYRKLKAAQHCGLCRDIEK